MRQTSSSALNQTKVSETEALENFSEREYEWGFVTDIEADSAPPGLNEEIIRFISLKKEEPEFMLDWRLKAYRQWLKMEDPTRRKDSERWAKVEYPHISYQDIVYYSAPKQKQVDSLNEIIGSTHSWYVHCIVPNRSRDPDLFDNTYVTKQLHALHVS